MKRLALIVFLTVATPLLATGPIKLPQPPAPVPMPPPAPAPVTVAQLNSDQWYVFESDVECLNLCSPDGLLKFSVDMGPITLKGKFVFGTGIETRKYTKKFVYTVEANGTGQTELIVVPVGVTKIDDIARQMLSVNQAPQPPPPAPIPPVPVPPVDPFLAILQAAYNLDTDTDKAASVAELCRIYKAAAALAPGNGFQTLQGIVTWIKQAETIAPTAIPKVRAAIGAELNKVLPPPSSTPLDQATKDLIAAQFTRIATALGGLK